MLTVHSEATLEAALLCFKYHKETNNTYQERLQLLSYVYNAYILYNVLVWFQEGKEVAS